MPDSPPEPDPPPPKAFLSYSWDGDAHKEWVKQLVTRLRAQGVNVTLDRWRARPGDDVPAFMERAVRENDFVITICTPQFKKKLDERTGGVGYEGRIMTAYTFAGDRGKRFIPVLRRGSWEESSPTWLLGTAWIDLSGEPYSESEYNDLLRTLHDAREEEPPLGPRPDFGKGTQAGPTSAPDTPVEVPDPPKPSPNRSAVSDWAQGGKGSYVPRPGLEEQVVALFQPRPGGSIGRDGPRIVTLKAEGGMGKTRLAIECAARVADLFPDGAHFVSLATTLPTEEAVAEAIGRALGLPAQACLPATVLDHLQGRTALLVLDNYESVDDPTGDPDHKVGRYLIRLLTEAHGLRLLVTGRSAVKVANMERVIDLSDGMTPGEARQLFLDQARLQWPADRVPTASEEPQLTRILDLTAKIPLAIELAAAWVGHCELKEIADGLEATPLGEETALPPGRLRSDVDTAHGRHDSLTRSLDWSYKLLGKTGGPSAQALFAACGLFADSFDEPTVATVAGVAKARNELHSLLDASLIRREADDGSNRYRLHRFTRDYALSRLDESPVAEETRRRFVAYYARLAEENATDRNDLARYALLDKEWRNARAALRIAETTQDTASSLLILSLGQFLAFRGLWSEAEFLLNNIIAIVRRANDKQNEGVILDNYGLVYKAQGRYDEALDAYARALDICRESKNRVGQGHTLNGMGIVYAAQSRYGEALDAYSKALEIRREFGDRVGQGGTLNSMGLVHQAQGRYDQALDAHAEALEICHEFKDHVGQGDTLNNMGIVYYAQGRYDQALDTYAEALEIRREFKDRVGQGDTLNNMGIVYQAQGRYDQALDTYAEALEIRREFKDRVGQGKTLINMGGLHYIRGRHDAALDAYAQSLVIRREFRDRVGEGQTLENLALLSIAQGDLPGAIRWARQAVEVLESTEATVSLEKARRTLNRLENPASG